MTLRWDNGKGLVFERVISIDANYMIDVTQRVTNDSGNAVSVFPYARIARPHIAPYPGHFRGEHAMRILHEGAIGFLQNRLSEWNYAKLSDNSEAQQIVGTNSTGGWLGMTDKYWLVALVPSQTEAYDARFVRTGAIERTGSWPSRKTVNDTRDFQVDYRGSALTVAPHTTAETKQSIFTGAKEVSQLDAYEISHNVPRFDLAVDFGWFYFLTKPLFYVLDWLGKHVGNFGVAILLLTLMVRAAVFPIASRSAMSMARMKKISPMMKELQARHKDDKAKLQLEMMALYKREKFNPAGGCLPILIQIPIFFSLYKVLFVTIEMRHAPFYGWIHDLSAPDPTSLFNLFGLLPFHPPIMLGLLPLLMGISMFIQMKMNPPPQDPTQAAMMNYMPLVFMFMMASFPAGLVLYWTLSNICGIAQQFYIKHKMKEKHVAPDPDMLQI